MHKQKQPKKTVFKPISPEIKAQVERPLGGNPGDPAELFNTVRIRIEREKS